MNPTIDHKSELITIPGGFKLPLRSTLDIITMDRRLRSTGAQPLMPVCAQLRLSARQYNGLLETLINSGYLDASYQPIENNDNGSGLPDNNVNDNLFERRFQFGDNKSTITDGNDGPTPNDIGPWQVSYSPISQPQPSQPPQPQQMKPQMPPQMNQYSPKQQSDPWGQNLIDNQFGTENPQGRRGNIYSDPSTQLFSRTFDVGGAYKPLHTVERGGQDTRQTYQHEFRQGSVARRLQQSSQPANIQPSSFYQQHWDIPSQSSA